MVARNRTVDDAEGTRKTARFDREAWLLASRPRTLAVAVGPISTPPFWTTIGPVSIPSSGRNTVTPDSFSPRMICHGIAAPPRKRGSRVVEGGHSGVADSQRHHS